MVYLPQPIFIPLLFLFGLFIGSFLNVLIWRLPQEKGIGGRSYCPNCKHQLHAMDLMPVASFLMQRGKCRRCSVKISARYPIIELATGLLFAIMAWHSAPHDAITYLLLVKLLIIASLSVVIFVIDLEHYLILDSLVFPGIILLIVLAIGIDVISGQRIIAVSSSFGSGILAAILAGSFFWIMWFVSKGKWMGFGDVKYALLMGVALGFPNIIIGLFLSFMIGAIVSMPLLLSGKSQLTSRIPFGTFLTIATLITALWGDQLWQGYANIIGL